MNGLFCVTCSTFSVIWFGLSPDFAIVIFHTSASEVPCNVYFLCRLILVKKLFFTIIISLFTLVLPLIYFVILLLCNSGALAMYFYSVVNPRFNPKYLFLPLDSMGYVQNVSL